MTSYGNQVTSEYGWLQCFVFKGGPVKGTGLLSFFIWIN